MLIAVKQANNERKIEGEPVSGRPKNPQTLTFSVESCIFILNLLKTNNFQVTGKCRTLPEPSSFNV